MSVGTDFGATASAGAARAGGVTPWTSVRRTVGLVLFGWAGAAVTAAAGYLYPDLIAVPISVGVVLCLAFLVLLSVLHRAVWLSLLSPVPALFVLVGAVQYAPEAVLEARGERVDVVIVADSAAGTSGDNHRYTLRGTDGTELKEKLAYNGDAGAPKVGDRLAVVRDPDGEVPMERADEVDAAGRLNGLIAGTAVWTLMAALAGRRGHVRRRRGQESSLDQLW
ncbi:hypothetical protein AB0E81_17560 [Streptomyces sp. NPDC033538]|uniref:hypothetical protein n=1 Tax=Streptomyces sp. NPDC033538 TaxID=3155367 RepID=UPI0033FC1CF4